MVQKKKAKKKTTKKSPSNKREESLDKGKIRRAPAKKKPKPAVKRKTGAREPKPAVRRSADKDLVDKEEELFNIVENFCNGDGKSVEEFSDAMSKILDLGKGLNHEYMSDKLPIDEAPNELKKALDSLRDISDKMSETIDAESKVGQAIWGCGDLSIDEFTELMKSIPQSRNLSDISVGKTKNKCSETLPDYTDLCENIPKAGRSLKDAAIESRLRKARLEAGSWLDDCAKELTRVTRKESTVEEVLETFDKPLTKGLFNISSLDDMTTYEAVESLERRLGEARSEYLKAKRKMKALELVVDKAHERLEKQTHAFLEAEMDRSSY